MGPLSHRLEGMHVTSNQSVLFVTPEPRNVFQGEEDQFDPSDRVALDDFKPGGDPVLSEQVVGPVTLDGRYDDDDPEIFEESLSHAPDATVVREGTVAPAAPVSAYVTNVVSVTVSSTSVPFMLLAAHPKRVSGQVIVSGPGVRWAPDGGMLAVVGSIPVGADGKGVLDLPASHTGPVWVSGADVVPDSTVQVTVYAVTDCGN